MPVIVSRQQPVDIDPLRRKPDGSSRRRKENSVRKKLGARKRDQMKIGTNAGRASTEHAEPAWVVVTILEQKDIAEGAR